MITLLGAPENVDLLWLAAALRRRGEHVDVVLPEELMIDSTLTCRIERLGVFSSLRLRDGRVLGADTPDLVINRLTDPTPIGHAGSAADATYLAEEWRAALAAWLRTLPCPVLNPPRAASLGGLVMSPAAWRSIASAHGLASRPWTSNETTKPTDPVNLFSVGACGIDPSGSAPSSFEARLRQMSQFVGAPLLGATFDRGDDWVFIDATTSPQLAAAGQKLVDAIIQCARERRVPA